MTTVIPIESLRRSPSAVLLEGGDDVALSLFVTELERGQGPSLHVHPYPEVFLVGAGDETLRVVSNHPSGTSEETWLEP